MTIAACYVSPEGVVLAADSTASYAGPHYFNHNQKIFEIGEKGTLAGMTWGLGGLGPISYRTLLALLADDLVTTPPTNVLDVINRWSTQFWSAYSSACTSQPDMKQAVDRCKALAAKPPFVAPPAIPVPNSRTKDEEEELERLRASLSVGFCIGGYTLPDRTPMAYAIQVDPLATSKPAPTQLRMNGYRFWGAPNMIQRLIFAADDATKQSIVNSGKWTGNQADLEAVLAKHVLSHPIIPIRDAIDFLHACVYSTIKGLKFSNFPQICGGPIETAVITTDRKFRWVHHKDWDAAIVEGVASPLMKGAIQ